MTSTCKLEEPRVSKTRAEKLWPGTTGAVRGNHAEAGWLVRLNSFPVKPVRRTTEKLKPSLWEQDT